MLTLSRHPIQGLRNGINLVIVFGAGKTEQLSLEVVEPRCALGKEYAARFKLGRDRGATRRFVAFGIDRNYPNIIRAQFLNQTRSRTFVLDKERCPRVLFAKPPDGVFEVGIIYALAPQID